MYNVHHPTYQMLVVVVNEAFSSGFNIACSNCDLDVIIIECWIVVVVLHNIIGRLRCCFVFDLLTTFE